MSTTTFANGVWTSRDNIEIVPGGMLELPGVDMHLLRVIDPISVLQQAEVRIVTPFTNPLPGQTFSMIAFNTASNVAFTPIGNFGLPYEQTVLRFRGAGLFGSYNPHARLCILFNGDESVRQNIVHMLGIPVVLTQNEQ